MMGTALLVSAAGAWLVAGSSSGRSTSVQGANTAVNAGAADPLDIGAHNSPALVRSPVDGAQLAVADRVDSPAFSCGVHLSSDAGATWRTIGVPIPDGEEPKCYAADAAFGADGTLYVSYVTLRGVGNVPNALWLATVGDDGLSAPVRVSGPLAFQARLATDPVDPSRLHLVWLQAEGTATLAFASVGNPIVAARSDDGGRTWTAAVRVSDASRLRVVAPSPVVGAGGELLVLHLDLGDDRLDYNGGHEGRGGEPYRGSWQLVLARSADATAWTEVVVEDHVVPTERIVAFLPPSPSLAVDHTARNLYAAFADGGLGDADVRIWRSHDGGATWKASTRVNDTPPGDATAQYLPKVSVARNGRVDVVYYDRRRDQANVMNEVSFQSSFDRGRTFTRRAQLSDRSFSSRVGFGNDRDLPDLGSRLGLVSTDAAALAVWSDTRLGTEDSRKQDLRAAVVTVAPGKDGPQAITGGLRSVAGLALIAGTVVLVRRPRRSEDDDGVAPRADIADTTPELARALR